MEQVRAGTSAMAMDFAKEAAKNFAMSIGAVRKWRLSRPRTATQFGDTDEFLNTYAFSGLNHLLEHTGDVKAKSICEIGAGDYLTSGLAMLAAGAARYSVIDRFPGDYAGGEAKHWYGEIEKNWARFYPERPWDKSLVAASFPENYDDCLELVAKPIEAAATKDDFDIICSFQVGEHVSDINAFAEIHTRLLRPDGIGLHRVDFGPHGCWSLYRDAATFLRFSDPVWMLTGSNRGAPNRRRHHEFLEAFDRAGLDTEVLLLEYFDEATVEHDKLNKKFREMPRESVMVKTAIYRLKKR